MTGDTRGEAERIVDRIETEFSWLTDEYDALRDRLVAALAAAIEVDHLCGDDEFYNMPPAVADHILSLRAHLSALRARAGEET